MLHSLVSALFFVAITLAPQDSAPKQKSSAKAEDDAAFVKSLDGVRRLEDASKWKEAQRALDALLNDTGDQPFVRGRRAEILEECRRIAIRQAVPQPDPSTLIHGKILNWDKKSGDVSLVYEPVAYDDFLKLGAAMVLPSEFDGPVTLKLEGDKFDGWGDHLLEVVVGMHADEYTLVALGAERTVANRRYPPFFEIQLVRAGKKESLAKAEKGPVLGKHFEVEVAVGTEEITVSCNGVRIGQAKHNGCKGYVGVFPKLPVKRLAIRGRASTAWLQGKLDAATHDAETKFLKTWDSDAAVPEWLRASAAPAPAAEAPRHIPLDKLPWPMTPPHVEYAKSIYELVDAAKYKEAYESLEKRKTTELPRDLLDYLFLVVLEANHALGVNAKFVARFAKGHPDFAFAHWTEAVCAIESGRLEDAAATLAALRGHADDERPVAELLVSANLLIGRIDDAEAALREATAAGITSPVLEVLARGLVNLRRGPDFRKRFEKDSDHFSVVTDMDAKTPETALTQLEESYRICEKLFGPIERRERMPVFLFAGRTGYESYGCNLDAMAMSTAGMYSPLFKQLLVWNLPDRDATARTLRHEATHQYLDRLGVRAPVWANEGLATYVEQIASTRVTDLHAGAVDRELLYRWARNREHAYPLEEFVKLPPATFYKNAVLTYAEAWGLIHFLMHGKAAADAPSDQTPQAVGQRLLAALKEKVEIPEVWKRAAGKADVPSLQKAFFDHVDRLCEEQGVH